MLLAMDHGLWIACLIYRKLGDVSKFFATTTTNVNVEESWIDSGFFGFVLLFPRFILNSDHSA